MNSLPRPIAECLELRTVRTKKLVLESIHSFEDEDDDENDYDLMVMATATAVAATGIQIRSSGNSAELECFADVLTNGRVDVVQLFLRVEESASDGIAKQCIAVFFERVDFIRAERLRALLLLLEHLALGDQSFILLARLAVRSEFFNLLACSAEFRLIQNRLAKFLGLLCNRVFLSRGLHNCLTLGKSCHAGQSPK